VAMNARAQSRGGGGVRGPRSGLRELHRSRGDLRSADEVGASVTVPRVCAGLATGSLSTDDDQANTSDVYSCSEARPTQAGEAAPTQPDQSMALQINRAGRLGCSWPSARSCSRRKELFNVSRQSKKKGDDSGAHSRVDRGPGTPHRRNRPPSPPRSAWLRCAA